MRIRRVAIYFLVMLLLMSTILGSGCTDSGGEAGENEAVESGDIVQVDYVGRLENGTIFDTSIEEVAKEEGIYNQERDYNPLIFTVGAGQMIKGFDEAVIGMEEGEEKTVTIPPEEAYGEYNESWVQAVPLEELNMSEKPEVGQVYSTIYGGQFKVIAVNETHVTFDANHELAGKTLVFDVKLVSIEKAE